MFNTLLYLCTTTNSDRVFPECRLLLSAKQTEAASGLSDRLMLSHPYTVACFSIKPVWLLLLPLPGPSLGCAAVCVSAALSVHGLCACLFAYGRVSMERYWKGSEYHPHQSPAQEENGERHGGWNERWRSPQEAAFGEKGEGRQRKSGWMDGAVPDGTGSDWAG